ncbi:MAG: fatty acid desaturase, partial [Candidatus Paceibacter sp.]|nr:fatty acid desaturase [Candidatus Paceibacter sp.]
ISKGIEDQVNNLLVLNAGKRAKEFLFFGCVYACGALLVTLIPGVLPSLLLGILLMGVGLNSLAIFIHEGLHGLLAKNMWRNHLLTFLVGLPIMISATAYYTTHVNHHYELGRKLDYGTYRQHARKPFFVWIAYFLQLTLGSVLYILFIPFFGFKAASQTSRLYIISEYIIIIAVFILFFTFVPTSVVLLYWGFPLLVLNVLTNIRGIASHALGDPENIYLSSRTVNASKLVSLLFLHENYHLEHHIFPRTPSYNLPAMHALIWDRLPQAIYSKSYPHFLYGLLKAALKKDLNPMGVVTPKQNATQ